MTQSTRQHHDGGGEVVPNFSVEMLLSNVGSDAFSLEVSPDPLRPRASVSPVSGADQDCGFESAGNRNTARASSRDSACRELDKTLRANAPKFSAVGTSPTSALPCAVSRSILPLGKAVSRKCFSPSFVFPDSGSGFP
jgi:hypothetical protein